MKTFKLLTVACLLSMIISPSLKAQYQDNAFPKLSVGISPSSLLSFYSGLQVSADLRIAPKLNSANELTYILGLLDNPGFRVKSGVQYCLQDLKNVTFLAGPNLIYQRVKTDVGWNYAFSFSERGYNSDIYFNENRVAGEMMGAMRIKLGRKFFIEFGLSAGAHYTNSKVRENSAENLRQLLIVEPEYTYEEMSNNSTFGLLTGFNLNFSYVIQN